MTSADIIAELKRDGWFVDRQKGSHLQLRHPTKAGLVTVPHPKKDLPLGTVKSIRKQAGI